MGKLLKILNDYKNPLYIFIVCIVVTMLGIVFNKSEFYKYNYERLTIQDCAMGWHDLNDKVCENFKDRQRKLDAEEIKNDGKIVIPEKSISDYIGFLASILQVVFIGMSMFILGASTKQEKISKLWKILDIYFLIVFLTVILNLGIVFVNGVFTSNDFLRFLFEILISFIIFILGRKL